MSTRKRKDRDFRAEIDAHIEQEAAELQSEGVAPDAARSAALKAFGNRTILEERFFESGRWMFWYHLGRDLRFGARLLLKDPRFGVLAVLGLALGIGISTAVFELIHANIRAAQEAAGDPASYVGLNRFTGGHWENSFSSDDYRIYSERATSFRSVIAATGRFACVLGPGPNRAPADVEARFESANFLSATGHRPAFGRDFSSEEARGAGAPVAMLNYAYWKRRFAGDPAVVGMSVPLNGRAVTIIGVADPRFGFGDQAGFYLPLAAHSALFYPDAAELWLTLDAVLRPGVSVGQAQAEANLLAQSIHPTATAEPTEGRLLLTPGGGNPAKRRSLLALATTATLAVAMILLIACSNLANLLLARAVVRRREIAVRLSLGAGRARLVGQLLTESLLLALGGGALGILFSHWLAQTLFVSLLGAPPGLQLHYDPLVLLYDVLLSIAAALSFGLAPALAATKTGLTTALHAGALAGAAAHSRRIWSARNGLVIVPLALSLLLLLGAGMAVRGMQHIYSNKPAFETAHLLEMGSPLHLQGYDEARTRDYQSKLLSRLGALPGIQAIALASAAPLSNGMGSFPLVAEGIAAPLQADYNVITSDFLATLGVGMAQGRGFTLADRAGSQAVALVNRSLALRAWPGESALGKRIRLRGGATDFSVVGVVPDLEDAEVPFSSVRPTVFVPDGQGALFLKGTRTDTPPYQLQFLVRVAGDPARVKAALRQEALALDSTLKLDVHTAAEQQVESLGPFRTLSLVLSALGILALVMASVGIYAILSYAVSQRTREIGIRVALGAKHREVLTLVMQRTALLIVCGIGLGMGGALVLKRVLASTVQHLGGMHAPTCIFVALLLGAVALLASYLPARKALRVDPMQALRWE